MEQASWTFRKSWSTSWREPTDGEVFDLVSLEWKGGLVTETWQKRASKKRGQSSKGQRSKEVQAQKTEDPNQEEVPIIPEKPAEVGGGGNAA